VLTVSDIQSQHPQENIEFENYLKQHLDLDQLVSNPVVSYSTSDSIIGSITDVEDSLFNARFYHLLGKLNAQKGNYRIAIEYLNTSESYMNAQNPHTFFIHNYLDRGNLYYKSKDPVHAREDYNNALQLALQLNDKTSLSTAYNNIGLLELNEGNMPLALDNFESAHQIRLAQNDSFLVSHSLGYMAMYHFHNGNYDKSISFYKQAIDQLKIINNEDLKENIPKELARLYNDVGYAYFKQGSASESKKSVNYSLRESNKIEMKQIQLSLQYQSARVLFFSGFYDEAIALATEIRDVSRDYNYKDLLLSSYDLLTDCHEKLKNYEKAMMYAKQVHQIKDRMNREQVDRNLANERFTFQNLNNKRLLQLIEKENQLKSAELDAQENLTQLLVLFVIISLLGIGALIYSNSQKIRVNKQLLSTNQLIEKQNLEIKRHQSTLTKTKTELEEKIKEMRGLTDEKTHLLSIVAHDLRTPLNSILGLTDLIEIEDIEGSTPESRKQYLDLIKESGNRMLGMINTLLNVRKIEGKNLEVNYTQVFVGQIITKILDDFKTWSDRKSISINIANIDKNDMVYVDENLYRQILENLISNALKYSPINSEIELLGEDKDSSFVVHVIDSGPGISSEDQEYLFTKYRRLSARPTAGEDSIGIGLSLVKKLAELMQGHINYTSELGKGSTFSVSFQKEKLRN
jgi:signal transduction histidine kinase